MADGNITVEVTTKAVQAELERLRAENAALKRDLQYARDGLTKGRARMREDNERLRAVLKKIEAGEYLHLPTMVREALGLTCSRAHQRPHTPAPLRPKP